MKNKKLILIVAALLSVAFTLTLHAQSTAFTYQGRLLTANGPANGSYDLQFALYDALVGGIQQGPTLTNSATVVSNGLFTVTLDFGNEFPGADRWLEIGVRTNNPASPESFVILSPRQKLAPTPYAVTAANVVSGGLPATYSSAVTFNNAANSFTGSFAGDGSGLTGVNAAALDGLAASDFWNTTGNAGTTAGVDFLGTSDDQPLELKANGERGLHLEYTSRYIYPNPVGTSGINVIGGYWGNVISSNVIGGTIAGGGYQGGVAVLLYYPNTVDGDFGSIGGGYFNTAGYGATVPGGYYNAATGAGSFAAGRYAAATNSGSFVWSDGSHSIGSTGPNRFEVLASGGVSFYTSALGINTANPQQQLEVNGEFLEVDGLGGEDAYLGGDGHGNDVQVGSLNTNVTAVALYNASDNAYMHLYCSSITIEGGADLAEPFHISHSDKTIPEGSVVVIDGQHPGQLKMSDRPYDTCVAGVISGANGVHPGIQLKQRGVLDGGKNVALTGRVYVRADACNGAIHPGDMLTTSSKPGYAMKVTDHARAAGAILGKAMTGLRQGQGMVLVLVTLQ